MPKAITEMMGVIGINNAQQRITREMPSYANINRAGPNVRHCATLEGWQRQIVNQLSSGRDQYIIARPGGGKTLPIICYWTDRMLTLSSMKNVGHNNIVGYQGNLNDNPIRQTLDTLFNTNNIIETRNQQLKLIFLVPTITLAQQTAIEIRRDISNIMFQAYNAEPDRYIRIMQTINPRLQELYAERGRILNSNDPGSNQYYQNNAADQVIQANRDVANKHLSSLNNAIQVEVQNHIQRLIDEMVYLRTGSNRPVTNIRHGLVYVSIYESANSIIRDIERPGLLVIDEAHLIQESGNPNDDNSRAYQIVGHLHSVLNNIEDIPTCRLAMLSGTINPTSARNIINYFNACYKRNFTPPVEAPATAQNRSALSIIPNESITSNENIVKNIIRSVSQRDWGQLYVLFSAKTITNIVQNCLDKIGIRNIGNITPSGFQPENMYSGLGERRRQTDIRLSDSSIDIMSIPSNMRLDVTNITNPLLRQAVLRGIGFIYRNIPEDPLNDKKLVQMNDQDKQIVAKLFKERKISVLLATDSVGIGVNIDVKDLYIPYIEKYSDTVKNNIYITIRDLSQILNRAGRGATPIASIHTPSRNMEIVTNALFAGPEDMPNVEEISKRRHVYCNNRYYLRILHMLNDNNTQQRQ